MRRLPKNFMHNLRHGFLAPLTEKITTDKDLDLHIRAGYLNVYYKGNSLLRLEEANDTTYTVDIHPKFTQDMDIPDLDRDSPETLTTFLRCVPALKENVAKHGKSSLELEYQQLIIRANNREHRNNSEYFIVDREYAVGRERFDLLGFYWPRGKRRRGQTVTPCLMEVKFALNTEISTVHEQLERYYEALGENVLRIGEEAQGMFRQRLKLGLYEGSRQRLDAMETLIFSRDIDQFQFVLVLVDYNPYSTHLNLEKFDSLDFAEQVRVFYSGFAMWQPYVKHLGEAEIQ